MLQDLRHALRILFKRPGFTAIAILTLGLGIGANTAIFTVVNAVLFRSLPYPQAERVMQVGAYFTNDKELEASEPKFIFWRDENRSFKAMAAYQSLASGVNLSGGSEPRYASGLRVSIDFFRVLGISPIAGRGFTEQEDQPGGDKVVIISDELRRQSFAAEPDLPGKTILLDGEKHTVVGVMPPTFRFSAPADVIVPLRPTMGGDQDHNYEVIARLEDNVTPSQALRDMQSVVDRFRAAYPNRVAENEKIGVAPLQEILTSSSRQLLLILLGAVACVLLIACANVANLQLARAVTRQKEMAIRIALGASWRRLVRQLLTESVLLALAGAAAGLLLAIWGVDYLARLIPEGLIPQVNEISVDVGVLAFTIAVAAFIGLTVGLAPAIQATRVDVNHSLKEAGNKGATTRGRLRKVLVVAEIAVALVLLVGAGLLIRTFANLRSVETGFDPRNVLTIQVSPRGQQYNTTTSIAEFNRRAIERIKSLPEVRAVAATNALPMSRPPRMPFIIEGQPDQRVVAQYCMVTPDYFRAMGIYLREGRDFTETDTANSEGVVIVNESFAREYLPEGDPLARRLVVGRGPIASKPLRVIAVASDFKHMDLEGNAQASLFVPLAQVPDGMTRMLGRFWAMKFVVRTASDPLKIAAFVKGELQGLDTTLAVTGVNSMEQLISKSIAAERFNMTLIGLFAALGLALAGIGIYGVMSYTVAERTHEIGIRVALGASVSDVLKMVLKQGLALAAIGVAIGLAASFALTRLMTSLLYGVTATDAATFVLIPLILVGVALLACAVPARRATRVDPMIALRYE